MLAHLHTGGANVTGVGDKSPPPPLFTDRQELKIVCSGWGEEYMFLGFMKSYAYAA